MRDTKQLEHPGRDALLGQAIVTVVTVALIAIVAAQVPDLMIWILN